MGKYVESWETLQATHRRALLRLALAGGLSTVALPTLLPTRAHAEMTSSNSRPGTMVSPADPRLAFIGQWHCTSISATTVNSGSRLLFEFTGTTLVANFNVETITNPPQIWVAIDAGVPTLYNVDRASIDLTPTPLSPGLHQIEIDVKDVDQTANRWIPPLQSALILTGFTLDPEAHLGPRPQVGTARMAFYGDSITEGIHALSENDGPSGSDGTKDYAFLTPLAFGAASVQVGFGYQGLIHPGSGDVPPAGQAFGYIYQGVRVDPRFVPDVVVINQGTNDQSYPSSEFTTAYAAYLRQFTTAYPRAVILAMQPFGGYLRAEIQSAIAMQRNELVSYVDTTGWLQQPDDFAPDGVHPNVAGHAKATARLVSIVAKATGWREK